jgi:hypothetical protein
MIHGNKIECRKENLMKNTTYFLSVTCSGSEVVYFDEKS